MVCFPRFPGSQVVRMLRCPIFPGSQVIRMVGFPILPSSQGITWVFFQCFQVHRLSERVVPEYFHVCRLSESFVFQDFWIHRLSQSVPFSSICTVVRGEAPTTVTPITHPSLHRDHGRSQTGRLFSRKIWGLADYSRGTGRLFSRIGRLFSRKLSKRRLADYSREN